MKRLNVLLVAFVTLMCVSLSAEAKVKPTEEALKNLKPYPETIDSLERYVIYLDQKDNEALYEVELYAGKVLDVDCNIHRLMGSFTEETVKGWGYNYYVFETDGNVISTMMMCPEPKTPKFISGENFSVRYNSRLPIVVYLPKGYELKYRIWTAGKEFEAEKN